MPKMGRIHKDESEPLTFVCEGPGFFGECGRTLTFDDSCRVAAHPDPNTPGGRVPDIWELACECGLTHYRLAGDRELARELGVEGNS